MSRQISTAISNGALALISIHAALQVLGISIYAFVAFVIVGLAATFGAVRFALARPSYELVTYHQYAAWLSRVIGIPFLAAAFHKLGKRFFICNIHLVSGCAMLVIERILSKKLKDVSTEVVSTSAVVSLIGICLINFNLMGVIGGACYVIAGVVIGTGGTLHGIPKVDVFHCVLALANLALMKGLQRF